MAEVLKTIVAPDKLKSVLKDYEPLKKQTIQRNGAKIRAIFDSDNLPAREQIIRKPIKSRGL